MAGEATSEINAIRPTDYTNLKATIKAECIRRNNSTGDVSSYGGASYDYTVTPATNSIILKEHLTKLKTPLAAINNSTVSSISENGPIKAADLSTMSAFVTTLSAVSRYGSVSNSGCSSNCTGVCSSCSGSCSGSCGGCGGCYGCSGCGGCDSTCSGSCTGGCTGGCVGQCASDCWNDVASGAIGGCGCLNLCTGMCQSSCTGVAK